MFNVVECNQKFTKPRYLYHIYTIGAVLSIILDVYFVFLSMTSCSIRNHWPVVILDTQL